MKRTVDNNRNKIIPDKLKNGIRDYMMRAEERNTVVKVHHTLCAEGI
jgi:hypothetical protein